MVFSTGCTDDILTEIFTHLPLKSIFKFKSLSKVWLSDLSNPNFVIKWFQVINNKSLPWIQYHTFARSDFNNNHQPLRFRSVYDESYSAFMSENEHLFSFKFLINHESFQGDRLFLLGSCNGMVLLLCTRSVSSTYERIVCNPLTKTWVSVPSNPHSKGSLFDVNSISCEYSSSSTSCYKVVSIKFPPMTAKKFNVDIFSSDLGVWRSFEVSCDKAVIRRWCRYYNAVILNGVLFWIEGGNRMLVYNLNQSNRSDRHRCSLINLPDEEFGAHANDFDCILGVSADWVCYARTRTIGRILIVSVWVLDEVNWQLLRKDILIDGILTEMRSRLGSDANIQVLGFSHVDRNVVFLGWMHWVWGIDIQTRSVQELCLDNIHPLDAAHMIRPFVLKPMPTVLPSPSWIHT